MAGSAVGVLAVIREDIAAGVLCPFSIGRLSWEFSGFPYREGARDPEILEVEIIPRERHEFMAPPIAFVPKFQSMNEDRTVT